MKRRDLAAPIIAIVFSLALAFGLSYRATQQQVAAQETQPAAVEAEASAPPADKAIEKTVDKVISTTEIPTVPEGESSPGQVIEAAVKSVDAWQSASWLAFVLSISYLLVMLTKLKPIDMFLKGRKLKWIRPLLGAIFGGVTAGVTAISTGQPIVMAIIAGVMAGLGSSGFHEAMSVLMSKSDRERRAS